MYWEICNSVHSKHWQLNHFITLFMLELVYYEYYCTRLMCALCCRLYVCYVQVVTWWIKDHWLLLYNQWAHFCLCHTLTHTVFLCAGDIRLVGGSDPLEGRVELFYEGEWGEVVAHRGTNAANFACRQAGYPYSKGIQSFVPGNGSVWLYIWIYSGDEQIVDHVTTMAGEQHMSFLSSPRCQM